MKLPEWLENELPAVRPVQWIDWNGEHYTVGDKKFTDVEAAFDFLPHNANTCFTDAAKKEAGLDGMMNMHGNRALITITDEEHRRFIEGDFARSVATVRLWRIHRNFEWAYKMLNSHPALWVKRPEDFNEKTFYWINESLTHNFYHHLTTDDNGVVGMCIEFGTHVPDNYTEHYHDYKLDGRGATFEEAVIKAAHNLDKYFDEYGVERDNEN